jgi:hypothetical protein
MMKAMANCSMTLQISILQNGYATILCTVFYVLMHDATTELKGKLENSLGHPEDKTEMLQKSEIYQVECEGCDSV